MNQFSGECDFLSNYFCTNSGCNSCQLQPVCPPEAPRCACGDDFRKLLHLICGSQLRPLINFAAFAVVSDFYILGTTLDAPVAGTAPDDNLAAPAGTYVCGSDSCETVTVSGSLYAPEVGGTALATASTSSAPTRSTLLDNRKRAVLQCALVYSAP